MSVNQREKSEDEAGCHGLSSSQALLTGFAPLRFLLPCPWSAGETVETTQSLLRVMSVMNIIHHVMADKSCLPVVLSASTFISPGGSGSVCR
ncbi:hypothetical protein BaRGS_00011108 [Batillaria attramentaria]|uniref:Uncharacterized protein n=1 Tax=Batillaria attramentaria TaxID=370345 RepID=A0ABD0JU84_9CAEN